MEEIPWEGVFLLLFPRAVGIPGQDVGALVGQLSLLRRRGDAKEVSGKNSNSAEATKPMWGAWLWGFGAGLCRELPLTSNLFPQAWAPSWHTSLDFRGRALATRRVTGSQGLVQPCQGHSQGTQTLACMINWKILEHIRKKPSSEAQDLRGKGNGDSQHPHTPAHAPRGAFLLEELLNLQSWHAPKVYKSSSWKERLLCWGLLAHLCGPRNRMKGSSWRRRAQSIPNSFLLPPELRDSCWGKRRSKAEER